MSGITRRSRAATLALLLAAATGAGAQGAPTYAEVAPVVQQRCIVCHSGPSPAAGLNLASLDALLKGSAKGPVVKAGDPAASELVRRIKGQSLPRMPMTGPPFLADAEIALIERWVAAGLPAGDAAQAAAAAVAAPGRPASGEAVTWLHVAPLFASRCAKCHADQGLMGPPPEGYRLTSYAAALASADRARVVPGRPEASELVRRVRGQARPRMPLDGPPYLDAAELRLIEDWVAGGARNAQGVAAPLPVGASVRLHGTLGTDGSLDGLALVRGPRTRIENAPAPADHVQVRGRLDEAGRVIVERLRTR